MCLTLDYFQECRQKKAEFEEIIEKLRTKNDAESLRTAALLLEEVRARHVNRYAGVSFSTAYYYEHFLDEYPPLEELEKRKAERDSITAERYNRKLEECTEKLRVYYHSRESCDDLAKRYLLEKMSELIAARIEKNRQRNQNRYKNINRFIADCLCAKTNGIKDMDEYIISIARVLSENSVELEETVRSLFAKNGADTSWIINWKFNKLNPQQLKTEEDNIYWPCYEAAILTRKEKEEKMRLLRNAGDMEHIEMLLKYVNLGKLLKYAPQSDFPPAVLFAILEEYRRRIASGGYPVKVPHFRAIINIASIIHEQDDKEYAGKIADLFKDIDDIYGGLRNECINGEGEKANCG